MSESRTPTARIHLPSGWAGCACVGEAAVSPGNDATMMALPTPVEWSALLDRILTDPETLPEYAVFKRTRSDAVYRCRVDAPSGPLDVVVKRGRARGLRRRLAFTLRGGRERRNFNRALKLRRAGVNVPMPLAVLQRGRPYPETCLVSAFVPGLVELDTVVMGELSRLTSADAYRTKCAIGSGVAAMLRRLGDHNLTHRDFKASNVMLTNWDATDEPPTVWLVDLDGVRPMRSPSQTRARGAVVRLAASLVGYSSVTRADQWRFLRHMEGNAGSAGRDKLKRRFRDLARRVEAYNRRSRRRKSGKIDEFSGD